MRNILILLFLVPFTFTAQVCEHLIWHDEFRGNELDSDKWGYDIGTGSNGWGNNELQYYTNSTQNAIVENDLLKIKALEQSFGGMNYTSARLVTRDKFSFASGRIETRVKLPSGQGIWPAFWMLPENWSNGIWPSSGEIDLIELLGQEPNKVYGTVHYGPYWPDNRMTGSHHTIGSPNFAEDFHEFSFRWTVDSMMWAVDGFQYHAISKNDINWEFWPFNQNMHMLLNVAVGGNWPGSPNASTSFPAEMHVDYIRVFQKPSDFIITGKETILENAETTYSVTPLVGTTFNWTVPSGASITSGQGTNEITVLWADQGGEISVETDKCCCMQSASRTIELKSIDCAAPILNAEGDDELYWLDKDGTLLENLVVPNPNAVNNSASCFRYDRNPGVQYDLIRYTTEIIDDASKFENGSLKFEMDVYTSAPAETEILIQLEEHEEALSSYPSGRHSVYKGLTQTPNQWHTISFDYESSPDSSVPNEAVNHILFLFAPNSNTNYFMYFDNLKVIDPSCQ